jgi:hypothetical protein
MTLGYVGMIQIEFNAAPFAMGPFCSTMQRARGALSGGWVRSSEIRRALCAVFVGRPDPALLSRPPRGLGDTHLERLHHGASLTFCRIEHIGNIKFGGAPL